MTREPKPAVDTGTRRPFHPPKPDPPKRRAFYDDEGDCCEGCDELHTECTCEDEDD